MRIGIDIGGSHVGVGLIDENGKIILKKEKDLLKEHKENIQDIIEITIINYINEIIEEQKIIKTDLKFIGIAFPASFRNGKYFENKEEDEKEIVWMMNNCYKYGFILRYPKEKEEITGFNYEPWHYRFVGKELAKYLTENHLTMEEYKKLDKRSSD